MGSLRTGDYILISCFVIVGEKETRRSQTAFEWQPQDSDSRSEALSLTNEVNEFTWLELGCQCAGQCFEAKDRSVCNCDEHDLIWLQFNQKKEKPFKC